ncbi:MULTISPECIES: hypothetical protein, partial [unclassified Pannonibacter]|uniref:hypothetical protein n=1 Tax=unclassified Pannonibacter TaxID=2627228 RepID=UPI001AD935EF
IPAGFLILRSDFIQVFLCVAQPRCFPGLLLFWVFTVFSTRLAFLFRAFFVLFALLFWILLYFGIMLLFECDCQGGFVAVGVRFG